MIMLLGIIVLFLIYYEIFILDRFDFKKMDVEDLLYNYQSNIDAMIEQVTNDEIDYSTIHSEEQLYCYIIDKVLETLENFLLREELTEADYKVLEDTEKIKDYISSRLSDINIDTLWKKNMYQYTSKQIEQDDELATEHVSKDIKSDESTVDILNDVFNIFSD